MGTLTNGTPELKQLLRLLPPEEHSAFTNAFAVSEDLREIVNRRPDSPSAQAQRDRELNETLDRLNDALRELAAVRNA